MIQTNEEGRFFLMPQLYESVLFLYFDENSTSYERFDLKKCVKMEEFLAIICTIKF